MYNQKKDIYQEITDRIIAALEAGTAPWLKPWNDPEGNWELPCNAVSGRFYQGVNILLLWIAAEEKGYQQSKWITARAANQLGGYVRRGEKATIIASYCPIEREKLDDDGNPIYNEDGTPEMEQFAILKRYPVFNIEQCEGLPSNMFNTEVKAVCSNDEMKQYHIYSDIRKIIDGMSLTVTMKPSSKAFYHSVTDKIVMPEMKQFNSEEDFYSVLLHEMTHATGHLSRLNRDGITSGQAKFGNKIYAFEELVAEMGGAFLCAHLGFNKVPQNAAYIESWLNILKSDKRAIIKASGFARKACEYMLETLDVQRQYERYSTEAA
ncbi:ArdC family protein [Gallibacterium anatis]|uniref:Antirestriction protein n=1 Tax=Gallibacterium anatis 12656/12 TaxID=1195244 RepID=U1I5H7_9PAST|nr:zincin-like metallopeptidase domain-containing protein [Gallibacterium anatis]ERF77434.1 antirestriction protein [Gallibacterium anatis 12656/12]KGQ25582.1 antirestriction protein [Gallibacterium anatis]KGQ26493.1 antirestriction protein [Gallibacterium anatis]KGQ47091.1 antirestriction protein [Gallibacterium anatis]